MAPPHHPWLLLPRLSRVAVGFGLLLLPLAPQSQSLTAQRAATAAAARGTGTWTAAKELELTAAVKDPQVLSELQEADALMASVDAAQRDRRHLELPKQPIFLGRGSSRHHEVPVVLSFPGSKPELEVVHVDKVPCNGDPDCGVHVSTPEEIEAPEEGVGGSSAYGDEVDAAEEAAVSASLKPAPADDTAQVQDMSKPPLPDQDPNQVPPPLD